MVLTWDVFLFARQSLKHESEKVLVIKTWQVYFIYPFLRRLKLGKSLQTSLSWHFKRENPYRGKHLFAKQELITRGRLRVQDFATGKNFCFNQCHNKEFYVFSQEFYFIKAIENFFSDVCIAWYKHSRDWENSSCANPRLRLWFAWLSRILTTPLVFRSGYANTETFSIAEM